MLALASLGTIMAQRTISGTIVDQRGEPLIGASVLVKSTSSGTVSDIDGNFEVLVPAGAMILVFSYTGFETQEVELSSSNVLSITLEEGASQLSEVVVTGYSAVKRGDLTSAISTVENEQIVGQPLGSVDQLLQGASTGLQITAENGRPGGTAYIRIRGTGSVNASNAPLFILDGIQITQTDYNAINPNDIEEISILKDAAATSIYGSRASNGVVYIKTKKGSRARKPQVTFNVQYGQKTVTDDGIDLMNKEQKLDYEVEVGVRSEASADQIRNSLANPETDWEDILLRTGQVQSYDLGLSGGGEKSNYYFSLSYYDEEGVSVGSQFDRLTGRFNMDFDVTKRFKVGNSITVAHTNEDILRDRNNVQNPFRAIYDYNPYEPEFVLDGNGDLVLDEDGEPIYNLTRQGFSISEAIRNNPENATRTKFIGSLYAQLEIIDGLVLKSQVGGNYNVFRREYYIFPGSVLDTYVGSASAPGIKQDNGSDRFIYNWTNTLAYNKTINGRHTIGGLFGTEYYKQRFPSYFVSSRGFPSELIATQNAAAEVTDGSTALTEWALWSQFAEARYNFSGRYYATFSWRRDGSSRFGEGNKFGNFFAGSVAWNIANEAFLSGSIFDQLKLRASAGTSGNEPRELYPQGTYSFARSYGNLTASVPGTLDNFLVKWEQNFNFSVGLDFGLFQNRLSGSFDYYSRTTSDLLFPQPLSLTTGWASRLANIGEMVNTGIELELQGDVVRSKNVTITLFGSITTNQNELKSLDNGGNDVINAQSGISLLREGLAVNTFYLVRYAGVGPQGQPQYFTAPDEEGNVEITDTWSGDDAVAIEGKTPQPTYFGNFGLNATFYGVDLGLNFYYSGGNYIYNFQRAILLGNDGSQARQNQDVANFNFWRAPGDENTPGILPAPSLTNDLNDSDRYLERGDYVRLRNATLGYTLPQKLMNRIGIDRLRVFVQGTNLLTFTNFNGDPEVGRGSEESDLELLGEVTLFTFPQTMGWTVGLNLGF